MLINASNPVSPKAPGCFTASAQTLGPAQTSVPILAQISCPAAGLCAYPIRKQNTHWKWEREENRASICIFQLRIWHLHLQLQSRSHPGRASCQVDTVLRANFDWSEALGSETLRAGPTTKALVTETSPVLAQTSLKWLMCCGLEALARGNSSFLSPRGFCALWRSRHYFLQRSSCYYNQRLVLFSMNQRECVSFSPRPLGRVGSSHALSLVHNLQYSYGCNE